MAESESKDTLSDSSDEFIDQEPWILYRDRPEWKDVEPLELNEGPFPVVAIAYSDRCKFFASHTKLKSNCFFLILSQRYLQLFPCHCYEQ